MKKVFLILVFISCAHLVFGQGNLQFNQVRVLEINSSPKTVVYSGTTQYYITDSIIVNVPVGKVFKVEYSVASAKLIFPPFPTIITKGCIFSNSVGLVLSLNDKELFHSCIPLQQQTTPLWLSSGNYVLKLSSDGLSTTNIGYLANALISGIEFNIVP